MVKGESKVGSMLAYLYVIIPVFIFCAAWTKIQFAVILSIILIISTFLMYRNAPKLPCFSVNMKVVIAIILLVGIWVYLSGIGGFVFQNKDHTYRNAIFNALVENDWPVVKEVMTDSGIQLRGMTYYIGFWLPSALVGKIFGLEAGYFFQYVWGVLGILIVYYHICCILQKLSVWPLVVFIFFGGLDILGGWLVGYDLGDILEWTHLEWWTSQQFTSICAQLFWVFNQAIPAWVITFMLYLHKDNKNTLFLWSMGMLNCTLPFVGMIPLIAYFSVRNVIRGYEKSSAASKVKHICFSVLNWIKSFFTFQNIIGALCVAVVMLMFLAGNTSVANTSQAGQAAGLFTKKWLYSIVLEVGVYFLVVWKYQKKNPLFYISLLWLMVCPLIKVGSSTDFCMRASIPALLMLYLLVVQTIDLSYRQKDKICRYLLIGLICVSSVTGIFEINRTITNSLNGFEQREAVTEETILTGSNFSSNAETNLFFKYLAR